MPMELVSINVASPQSLQVAGRTIETGIFKQPVATARVTDAGLDGDSICDARHHGGPDQALYVYGLDDYRWWQGELDRTFTAGEFGENLTVDGLQSADVAVGDRLVIDQVILEATAARIPCNILGERVGNASFPAKFRRAERPGFYCRVLHGGELRTGALVTVEPYTGERVTIAEMFRAYYASPEVETLRRQLGVPIAMRARQHIRDQLAKLTSDGA